jgi:[ribosomal protein S5]-alanine N-acetyltransferase
MLTTPYTGAFPVLSINSELCLRQPLESDTETLCAYYQDPEVGKFILASNPDTLIEAKSELQYNRNLLKTRRGVFWSIASKDKDEMMGTVGLYTNNFHHRAEICYDLAKPHWRKGIMTQALAKVLDYCFSKAGFMRIEAVTMLDNEASQELLKKLGFEFDSVMKNYRYYEGSFHDVNMYSITPDIWQKSGLAGQVDEINEDEEQLIDDLFPDDKK